MFLDRIHDLTESIVRIDQTIGFKRLLLYVFLGLFVFVLFNFKTIIKSSIELVTDLSEEIHNEKMAKRDELLAELNPILASFRTEVKADRVLYLVLQEQCSVSKHSSLPSRRCIKISKFYISTLYIHNS